MSRDYSPDDVIITWFQFSSITHPCLAICKISTQSDMYFRRYRALSDAPLMSRDYSPDDVIITWCQFSSKTLPSLALCEISTSSDMYFKRYRALSNAPLMSKTTHQMTSSCHQYIDVIFSALSFFSMSFMQMEYCSGAKLCSNWMRTLICGWNLPTPALFA